MGSRAPCRRWCCSATGATRGGVNDIRAAIAPGARSTSVAVSRCARIGHAEFFVPRAVGGDTTAAD
jgi:hypothetical protein